MEWRVGIIPVLVLLRPAPVGLWGHAARMSHAALEAVLSVIRPLGISNAWACVNSTLGLYFIPGLVPGHP